MGEADLIGEAAPSRLDWALLVSAVVQGFVLQQATNLIKRPVQLPCQPFNILAAQSIRLMIEIQRNDSRLISLQSMGPGAFSLAPS